MIQPGGYLWRTLPDGTRQVSWRVWPLVFAVPGLFAGFAAFFAGERLVIASTWTRTEGEVVRVHARGGWTPWTGATTDYSPVFRYEFRPGETTEASTGQSSPNWNRAIGSRHPILFDPSQKGDVRQQSFELLWALPAARSALAALTLIPALVAMALIRRWRRGGPRSRSA